MWVTVGSGEGKGLSVRVEGERFLIGSGDECQLMVGDPKVDLGWTVQAWPKDTNAPDAAEATYVDMTGMPSRDEVVAHYGEVSGRQVDDIDYYVILAKWKLAIVLEQGFQRAGDDEKLLAFGPLIVDLMHGAAELAESTDYDVRA